MLCGVVMVFILNPKNTLKKLLYTYIALLMFTFVHGGLVLALQNAFDVRLTPILVLIAICFFSFFIFGSINKFYKTKAISSFLYKIRIDYKGKREYVSAYLDSGNLLTDSQSGLPILILDYSVFENIFGISAIDFVSGKISHLVQGHYQNYSTISSYSKLFVFGVDNIYLCYQGKEEKIDAMIGTSFTCHFPSPSHALLGPLMLNMASK